MTKLINTSDLALLVKEEPSLIATAKTPESDMIEGYFLHLKCGDEDLVLSTYLSDKPRLFKRSDALLKEAKKLGIGAVTFEIYSSKTAI